MAEYYTIVTRKGQITIPADVRRALDLRVGDRVAVRLEDSHASIARAESAIERTRGMLKDWAISPAPTAEELRELAAQAIAQDGIARQRSTADS